MKKKIFVERRIDRFFLLLLFFTLLLFSLFYYLESMNNKIKHYRNYQQKFETMINLNHQLENLFLRTYRYIDYDKSKEILDTFEESIDSLQKSEFREEFGSTIYREFGEVEQLYREKLQIVEDFKTLNARVTNSIHYLYDLRKTIEKRQLLSAKREAVLDHIFFTISQILMELHYNKEQFDTALDSLKSYSKGDQTFAYFYQHTKQFLLDITKIKRVLQQGKEVKLLEALRDTMYALSISYEKSRDRQKTIALAFFFFSFLILILLALSYRHVRKTTRELLAFRYAIEKSDNAIVVTDTNRQIEYVNEAFEYNSGYKKEEVLGENPSILKSHLLDDAFYKNMNETLNRGERWQGELINRRKDGSLLYEKTSIVPILLDGTIVKYLAIKLDVTEYKEQQKKLQQSATVYQTIGDGIMITDSNKQIVSVNPAFMKIFGYDENELIGEETMIISGLRQDESFIKRVWSTLMQNNRWAGKIYSQAKNGKILPVWLTVTAVKDKEGEVVNFIAIYTNLEDMIEMEERANFLAYYDTLTHLPNRAYFEREIIPIFDTAKKHNEKIAVMFIDLDRFKVINDTLGHHVGDEMLIMLAKRIKAIVGKDDLVARIGGDEFVVILDPLKKRSDATVMAEKLLSVMSDSMPIGNYHLNTTASIGIAVYPDDGVDTSEIIKHADSAMYSAKEGGKNIYAYYTKQLSVDIEEHLKLEQALKYTIKRGELSVYYQPQYSMKSGRVSGAEALVRWDHPTLGRVSPELFIPVAEETGFIIELGYFVFETSCQAYMKWQAEGLNIETIAVNISAVQFRDELLFENFQQIMKRTGISPHHVEIEITERFIMEDSSLNIAIIERFRTLGCKISIDDFGTGYSSMSYMKSLPLDTIKIDKSFVDDLPDSIHDAAVSKAIIALSKSLGYHVIAEGIENRDQEKFLRDHGCDIGQGYHFAKPMDAGTFVAFVKAKQL